MFNQRILRILVYNLTALARSRAMNIHFNTEPTVISDYTQPRLLSNLQFKPSIIVTALPYPKVNKSGSLSKLPFNSLIKIRIHPFHRLLYQFISGCHQPVNFFSFLIRREYPVTPHHFNLGIQCLHLLLRRC